MMDSPSEEVRRRTVAVGGPLAGSSFVIGPKVGALQFPRRHPLKVYGPEVGFESTERDTYHVVNLYDHVYILLHEDLGVDDALRLFIKAYESVQTNKSDPR